MVVVVVEPQFFFVDVLFLLQLFLLRPFCWRLEGCMGSRMQSLRPMTISDGTNPLWMGVHLDMSNARYGSADFFSKFLIVWIAHSASPLFWGYLGELIVWVKL